MHQLINFGDSITVGVGASQPSKSWVGLLTPINLAVSGSQAAEVSNAVLSVEGDNFTVMIGTNDVRVYKNDVAKQAHFKHFFRGILSALSHPIKTHARDMLKTGVWGDTVVNDIGLFTTQNGAKLTATVYGSKIFINYIIQSHIGALSQGDVYIDGEFVGGISCDGYTNSMTTQNGLTYGNGCKVFEVCEGEHIVEILNTGANGKYFYVNYVATEQTSPKITVSNVIKLSDSIYTSLGISCITTDTYNSIISNVLSDFNVMFVDNYADIIPSLHLADGVHPNDLGQKLIFNNFLYTC